MSEREKNSEFVLLCVCVCVCMRARVCLHAYVCTLLGSVCTCILADHILWVQFCCCWY